MASLTTTTIFHNSSQHHFSFAPQSHLLLQSFANERSNPFSITTLSSSGSVRALAANIREQSVANGDINAIVLDNKEIGQANEMVRLIALKLQPLAHKRASSSLGNLETLTAATPSSTSATRPRSRSSISVLNTLPYTQEEWKISMEEVKGLFKKRQYKRCSTRLKQILDSTTDSSQFHPLYTIYLCYYTAISLEQTARSLHNNSPSKLPLFLESLNYLQKTLSCLPTASFTAAPKTIRLTERQIQQKHNYKSSISSSNRSSIDSIFSQASSTSGVSDSSSSPPSPREKEKDGRANSHRRNLSSMEMKPAPLRIHKKVSFSQQLPTLISQAELRFEENEDLRLIDCFPLPPPSPSRPSSFESESEKEEDSEPSRRSLAITRYQNHLTTFSGQLEYHIDSINSQIGLLTNNSSRRPSREYDGGEGLGLGIGGIDGVEKEEIRRVELQERIQRLKTRGWERRRFDASKYQILCERALSEVEGC